MVEIRCSGLARVMQCLGSLFFTLPPQPENDAAKEGTAAGEYLRALLETGAPPKDPTASNGVPFDADMEFYTRPIAQEILERAGTQVLCEQKIDWQTRSGIVVHGSYDVSYVGKDGKLYVDDLKYGWGIVDVKENWQLLGYAIGEVVRRGVAFEKIVLRIHQPRPHHEDGSTRAWELTYDELLSYREKIETRMAEIAAGSKELTTGGKCKYCPAAAEACPAFNRMFYRGIEYSFEFLQDQISEKELAHQLDLVQRVMEVLKIKNDSLEALAVQRIRDGRIIPGFVTEARYGDRQWRSGISPEAIEVLTGKKIVERTMLSPAKAEKAGVPKDFVNALVERRFLGQKIVRKDTSALGDKIFGKPKELK